MKTLFPLIERDIAESRLAERRENRHRCEVWLRDKQGYVKWVLKRLDSGEALNVTLMAELGDIFSGTKAAMAGKIPREPITLMFVLEAMRITGLLAYRKNPDVHPSGEDTFFYRLRKRTKR